MITLLVLATLLLALLVHLAHEVRLDGYGRRPGPRSHAEPPRTWC